MEIQGINREELYPLSDGARARQGLPQPSHLRVRWTGEVRCLRAGDWYLSGPLVKGYQIHGETRKAYHVGELVEVETKTTVRVVRVIPQQENGES